MKEHRLGTPKRNLKTLKLQHCIFYAISKSYVWSAVCSSKIGVSKYFQIKWNIKVKVCLI